MIESLRDLKLRIKSIQNTQKITRAMEMVSSAKLSRARGMLLPERPYFEKMESMMKRLLTSTETIDNPFFASERAIGRVTLCVITSDAGLCSVYNYSIIRAVEDFVGKRGKDNVDLIVVGREGYNYFAKNNYRIANKYVEFYGRYSETLSGDLYNNLTQVFLKKETDEVYIAYTHFTSTLRLRPKIEKFLNLECKKEISLDYIFEPDKDRLIERIVPAYLAEKVRLVILDSFTSEHASRMVAMKLATDNARDLIDTLTLLRNKARQASITKEILEVVMSAEALKGQ